MKQLWQEYEDASTPEAKLVKDFDKVRVPQAQNFLYKVGRDHSMLQRLKN